MLTSIVSAATECKGSIKPASQDRITLLPAISAWTPGSTFKFVGVYDGHNGDRAAQFCQLHAHEILEEKMKIHCPRDADRDSVAKGTPLGRFENRTRSLTPTRQP